jgi:hypothetical protein
MCHVASSRERQLVDEVSLLWWLWAAAGKSRFGTNSEFAALVEAIARLEVHLQQIVTKWHD